MTETAEAARLRIHALWQEKLAADIWNGWRALLANWKIEGTSVPVDPNVPFQGYYRSKRVDKTYEPIAFFKHDGKWTCLRPARERYQVVVEGEPDWDRVMEGWPHVSRRPISHTWYKLVAEEGKPWPDADARVTSEALATSAETPPEREVKVGDNNPPEETPVVALKNKIENAKGGLKDYAVIGDEETQTKARSLKNRLTELSGEAKKERDKFSRPHLDALEVIRGEWSPLVDDAAAAAATIVKAMNAWETKKLDMQRAEEKRVADEKVEAERVRIANKAKTQQAEATGTTAELEKIPEVKPAAPTPQVNTQIGAAYGRKAAVKTEWEILDVTDAAALFTFLTTPKIHSELKTKMMELAKRAKDAGFDPPGVSMKEVAKVKG